MLWHERFPTHKHGCRKEGRNSKFSAKKAVFLVSSGKKTNFLTPVEKGLEKSTSSLPGKNPSDAHAHKYGNYTIFVKIVLFLHHLVTLFNNTNAVSKQ